MTHDTLRAELTELRGKLDGYDKEMMETLKKRIRAVGRIGVIKEALGMEPLQPERYAQMMDDRRQLAEELGLPVILIEAIWEAIHKQSVESQQRELV